MKNSLAIVASLVATFVLGAVVAMYGFGDAFTATATGCSAYRPDSPQRHECVKDGVEYCENNYRKESEDLFRNCLDWKVAGGKLIRDKNLKESDPVKGGVVPGTQDDPMTGR